MNEYAAFDFGLQPRSLAYLPRQLRQPQGKVDLVEELSVGRRGNKCKVSMSEPLVAHTSLERTEGST